MIDSRTPIKLLSLKVEEKREATFYKIEYAARMKDGSWINCAMSPNDVEWKITEEQKISVNAARQELTIAMMWLEMRIPERAICDYIATNHGNSFTHFASVRNDLVMNTDQFLLNKVRGWEDYERYERFYEVTELVINSALQGNVVLKGTRNTKGIKQNISTIKLNLENNETIGSVLGVYWYEFLRYHIKNLEALAINMVRDLAQKQAIQLELFDNGEYFTDENGGSSSDELSDTQNGFSSMANN